MKAMNVFSSPAFVALALDKRKNTFLLAMYIICTNNKKSSLVLSV